MINHTPGPWTYGLRDSCDTAAGLCTVRNVPALRPEGSDGAGQTWAHISADVPCWEVTAEQREANGRLMAAAPELLIALRDLYDLVDCGSSPDAFKNGVTDSTGSIDEGELIASRLMDAARAILTKLEAL